MTDLKIDSIHAALDQLEATRHCDKSKWTGLPYDLLLVNCRVATMDQSIDSSYGEITEAAVAIHQGKFVFVGKETELPLGSRSTATRVEDLGGRWVRHTHLHH